jgi:hypothetical protein
MCIKIIKHLTIIYQKVKYVESDLNPDSHLFTLKSEILAIKLFDKKKRS